MRGIQNKIPLINFISNINKYACRNRVIANAANTTTLRMKHFSKRVVRANSIRRNLFACLQIAQRTCFRL